MNLQVEKQALIKALEQTNDEGLIRAIQQMVEYAAQRDEEYLGATLEQYNKELNEANARIEQGNFVDHEEAIKQIQAWRTKGK